MNAGTLRSTWPPGFPGLALALALAFGFTLFGGCQAVLNLDELNNGQCKEGQKRCENRCVSLTDPATGCADPNSCAPCVLPHASAHCELGVCQIAACNGDYEDCDHEQAGCETDLAHDPKHCGACDAPECKTTNGIAGCSARKCATGGCSDGWDDCNKDPLDGCERPIGTDTDCAGCDLPCAAGLSCAQRMCI